MGILNSRALTNAMKALKEYTIVVLIKKYLCIVYIVTNIYQACSIIQKVWQTFSNSLMARCLYSAESCLSEDFSFNYLSSIENLCCRV